MPTPNSITKKNKKKREIDQLNQTIKSIEQNTSTTSGSSKVEESIMKNIRK